MGETANRSDIIGEPKVVRRAGGSENVVSCKNEKKAAERAALQYTPVKADPVAAGSASVETSTNCCEIAADMVIKVLSQAKAAKGCEDGSVCGPYSRPVEKSLAARMLTRSGP